MIFDETHEDKDTLYKIPEIQDKKLYKKEEAQLLLTPLINRNKAYFAPTIIPIVFYGSPNLSNNTLFPNSTYYFQLFVLASIFLILLIVIIKEILKSNKK